MKFLIRYLSVLILIFQPRMLFAGKVCNRVLVESLNSKGKVELSTIQREIAFNKPFEITNLGASERTKLFKEIREKNLYVDLQFDQYFIQGKILEFGKSVTLSNGTALKSEVTAVTLRGFHGEDATPRPQILPVNLQLELKLSKLEKSIIEILKSKGAGVISLEEFVRSREWRQHAREAYLLGLGRSPYSELSKPFKMIEYDVAYRKLGVSTIMDQNGYDEIPGAPSHTDVFMKMIRNSKKVFLVPRNVLTYVQREPTESDFGDKDITKNELRWLLAHPESLTSTLFVFGAYDCWSESLRPLSNQEVVQVLNGYLHSSSLDH